MSEDKFVIRGRGWARGGSTKAYRPVNAGGIDPAPEGSGRVLNSRKQRNYDLHRLKLSGEAKAILKDLEQEKIKKAELEESVNRFYKILKIDEQREVFDRIREYGLAGILSEYAYLKSEYQAALTSKNLEMLRNANFRAASYAIFLEECKSYRDVCKIAFNFKQEPKTPVKDFLDNLDKLIGKSKRLQEKINNSISEIVDRK